MMWADHSGGIHSGSISRPCRVHDPTLWSPLPLGTKGLSSTTRGSAPHQEILYKMGISIKWINTHLINIKVKVQEVTNQEPGMEKLADGC